MVNRIDENNYHAYQKTRNVNTPNAGEKFNLNYGREELLAEDREKEDKTDSVEKRRKSELEQSGVRLELSEGGKNASADKRKTAEEIKSKNSARGQSILGTISEILTAAISAVKNLLFKIWNEPDTKNEPGVKAETDPEVENVVKTEDSKENNPEVRIDEGIETGKEQVDVTVDSEKWKTDKERLDREIQPYLRKGDLNQVLSLLTDNGKKTVAMNSTLLTYYDRNGKMVEINASDRERILRGDRNTKKL